MIKVKTRRGSFSSKPSAHLIRQIGSMETQHHYHPVLWFLVGLGCSRLDFPQS
jgi:hypothetical protein